MHLQLTNLPPSCTVFSSAHCLSMCAVVVYSSSDYGPGYVEHIMDIKYLSICTYRIVNIMYIIMSEIFQTSVINYLTPNKTLMGLICSIGF